MSHRSFQLWVGFGLHIGCSAYISSVFLGFLLPQEISFFCLLLPKYLHFIFLYLKSCSFLTSKYSFAIFVLDLDTLLSLYSTSQLYWGVRETNLFLFSLYLYVKNGSSQEVNSPWAISLVTPCQVAADLPLYCRYIHFYADSATQSPIYCKKVWARPAHSLWFSSSDNHKCVVLRCTVVYCKRVERQVIYGLALDLLSISWKPVSARNWQSQLHLLFLV